MIEIVSGPTEATLVGDDSHDVEIEIKTEKTLTYECTAKSDPSTPVAPKWFYVTNPDKAEVLHSDPPEITVNGGKLIIQIAENTTARWYSYMKQFKCIADNGYSKAEQVVTITSRGKSKKIRTFDQHPEKGAMVHGSI